MEIPTVCWILSQPCCEPMIGFLLECNATTLQLDDPHGILTHHMADYYPRLVLCLALTTWSGLVYIINKDS